MWADRKERHKPTLCFSDSKGFMGWFLTWNSFLFLTVVAPWEVQCLSQLCVSLFSSENNLLNFYVLGRPLPDSFSRQNTAVEEHIYCPCCFLVITVLMETINILYQWIVYPLTTVLRLIPNAHKPFSPPALFKSNSHIQVRLFSDRFFSNECSWSQV